MADIIIVEDNEEIGTMLADFLEGEGYDTYLSPSGEEALDIYREEGARLLILDVNLPGMDGFAVLNRIREESNIPILVVSARDSREDKLNGIMSGADDYIEKPFDVDILIAKVKGIFKRRYSSDEITAGNIRLDKKSRRAYMDNREIILNVKEYELLAYLMENRGRAVGKDELFNSIWGSGSESETQTLTVHIKWLREKIEHNPKKPERILTVWGVGYRFE